MKRHLAIAIIRLNIMFLATSSLREFWNESDDLLLLGPWCLGPGESIGPRQRLLPCPWDDRARLGAGIAYCQTVHLRLVEALAEYLNASLGLSLSLRYWRILLGPWALYHTHMAFIAYTRLTDALKVHPDLRTLLLQERDFYTPLDTEDFVRFFRSDLYNLQLASHLLRGLGMSFPERTYSSSAGRFPPESPAGPVLSRALKAPAAGAAAWAVRHAPCEVLTDGAYPMGRHLWRLMVRRPFRLWPFVRALPRKLRVPAVPDARRLGLAKVSLSDEFGRLLAESLPHALPSLFLEGLPQAREYARSLLGRTPRLIVAGSRLHFDDLFKLAAAELSSRGARIAGFEHGGGYGTAEAAVAESHERAVTDAYWTWGWASTESDPRLRDVPVPHVSQWLRRNPPTRRAREGILYATSEGLKSPHHLFHMPLEQQWEDFFDWRDRFLRGLSPDVFGCVRLRFPPGDFGWGQKERVRALFPALEFDDPTVPFLSRAGRARLVVTDHPTTVFLETLALGVPSVHFWREDLWELREGARPYFEALKDAGVIHANPESAAGQAARVYADPAAWWESDKVRAAREEFVRRFVRTDSDWVSAWNRAIEGELKTVGP